MSHDMADIFERLARGAEGASAPAESPTPGVQPHPVRRAIGGLICPADAWVVSA